MMRATCGHEIDSMEQVQAGSVYTKDHTREGKRAVSYRVLCPACLVEYRRERLVLETTQQRARWLRRKRGLVLE